MSDLVIQRMYYIGVIFHSMLYGMEIYMYFQSVYIYRCQPKATRRQMFPYILIGGLMVFVYAWAFAADALYGQLTWIEHPNWPGGPVAYFETNTNIWIEVFGTFASMVADWLGEGLLMYRCWIIWEGRWSVIAFPFLLLLGSIAMGLLATIQSALPGSGFFTGMTINYGLPWIILTVMLNVTLTTLICVKKSLARRMVQRCLEKEDLKVYTSIMAILIESSLPFSILGIVFAIAYGKGWSLSFALENIWGILVVVSPQFIILRVVMGRAWTRDIASRAGTQSSVEFNHETSGYVLGISIDSERMELETAESKGTGGASSSSGTLAKVESNKLNG